MQRCVSQHCQLAAAAANSGKADLVRERKIFGWRSFVVHQSVASRLELLVEECVGQLMALHKGVCHLCITAHHLLHSSAIEGQ